MIVTQPPEPGTVRAGAGMTPERKFRLFVSTEYECLEGLKKFHAAFENPDAETKGDIHGQAHTLIHSTRCVIPLSRRHFEVKL